MSLLDRLRRRKVFTPLEERLLLEVRQRLPPDAAGLFIEQVRSINKAQRHSDGREVCYYPMQKGEPVREDRIRFPATREELKLATVRFDVPRDGKFTAEFHLVGGYFFSIEFTPSPARIADRNDIVVLGVELHRDPMVPPPSNSSEAHGLPADARTWPKFFGPRRPLSDDEQTKRLAEIESQLPADYLDEMQASASLEGPITVLGLADVYSVVLEDATYYVLAAVNDSAVLAVRKHASDGFVYFLPFDDSPRPLGTSFRDAVKSATPE